MSEQPFDTPFFNSCVDYFRRLQGNILEALEAHEPEKLFLRDEWAREPLPPESEVPEELEQPLLSGNGLTCVIEDGEVWEKAGVNFSDVTGYFSSSFAGALPGASRRFRASGVSLVIHPRNPLVPTVHMNVRHIQRGEKRWFGGGADLTPYYLDPEDGRHFHKVLREACDAHSEVADYEQMREECDEYFYIAHRNEPRGVGGIFFDYLDENHDKTFDFVRAAGDAFLPAYMPIVEKHVSRPYGERERQWQLYRRGRYVEFNLVYDRGTTFGLKTGGRIESILMSLPLNVQWRYDHKPEEGTDEARLLAGLQDFGWRDS